VAFKHEGRNSGPGRSNCPLDTHWRRGHNIYLSKSFCYRDAWKTRNPPCAVDELVVSSNITERRGIGGFMEVVGSYLCRADG